MVGKNVRLLAGIPLIVHSIRQAADSGLFAHIAVSSDDPAILEVAGRGGADILVKRPDEWRAIPRQSRQRSATVLMRRNE